MSEEQNNYWYWQDPKSRVIDGNGDHLTDCMCEDCEDERSVNLEWILLLKPKYSLSRGMFSRERHAGYTNSINEAGRFSEREALGVQNSAPEKYIALHIVDSN